MKRICYLLLIIGLAACENRKEKTAGEYLTEAKQLFQSENYNTAKLKIDSINTLFVKDINNRKEANHLLLQIELKEHEQSLEFLKTSLLKRQEEADSISKGFILEKNEKYQETGNYLYKTQSGNQNLTRTMLKAYVEETGNLYFSCVIFAKSRCEFEAIRVSVNDIYAETLRVTPDGAFNRSYNDGLYYWQTVTFKNKNDNGVAAFIVQYADKKLKVNTIGKCKNSFFIDQPDKKAFQEAYNLSVVLTDITYLKSEITKSEKMISRLQERISAKE